MKDIHKYDNEIMLHAANIAIKSDMRSKHGCVIVDKKGNIISAAHNSAINITDKSNLDKTYKKGNKISRHAEENALRMVDPKKLDGAKLYVVR